MKQESRQPIPVAKYTRTIGVSRRRDLWGISSLEPYAEGDFDIKVAYKMVHTDPTLAAAWTILQGTLLSHWGGYWHEDERIREFVTEALEGAEGWNQAKRALLTAPLYGFSVVEETWRRDADHWRYARLRPVHPTTIDKGFELDKDGNITGVRQKLGALPEREPIPINKIILWSFGDEFGESPQGQPLLKPAYRHYHSVKAILTLWNSQLEQGPRPLLAWSVGPGEMFCPIHQVNEPAIQVTTELAENVTDKSAIIYMPGEDGSLGPTVLANQHIRPEDFLAAVRFHNGEILKALLVPRLLVEEAEFGTRAQAQVQFYGPFIQNVRGIQAALGGVLVDQVARRLIEVNFPGVDDYGEWQFDKIDTEDEEQLAAVLERLVRSGIMLTDADLQKIRGVFDELLEPQLAGGEEAGLAAETGLPDYGVAR